MPEDTQVDKTVPAGDGKVELALVTNAAYGYQEQNGVGLVFSLQLLGGQTILFMDANAVTALLEEKKMANVLSLKGRPCSVNVDPGGVVTFNALL